MRHCQAALAACILLAGSPTAWSQDDNRAAAQAVVEAARKDCEAFEAGKFETAPAAIRGIDLSGDDVAEYIVDAAYFTCSSMASGYCGTGGCQMHVIVEGKTHELLGRDWRVVSRAQGVPVLKFGVHWSLCDYQSYCTQTLQWNGNGFASLGVKPEPPDE